MLNSVSSSMAYSSQDILKPKLSKSENVDSKSDVKQSSLSPKAAAIAEQIANGTYKIDLKATANAILNELS
ncbi:anti-sigma factor FlgM [Campylobacter sp. RM5004]|uniref:flagellar biosynthesis anti-sigma factor FlgM n=1 Tax=Campylobacter sp. RM5004 TaxID=1660078 RepID=UPI001EFA5AD7|nr:flagellar biosynthesis anti-sigma factor FlgM [Campylobacter sp. RM5004]ULO02073.1 anti-sigma factor FlgM [Campylobacter sp. RM5004]